jgi:hypothetical protein
VTLGYLDPGSGSLIISAVVGGAAAAGVAVKQARSKVTGVFKRKSKSASEAEAEAEVPAPVEPAMATETAEAAATSDDS